MSLELHAERKIGYKKLSDADLGTGRTSHQTHIGLSQRVLSFLPDGDKIIEKCPFIYDDKLDYIDACFSKIEDNKTGRYRSPYIKTGNQQCVSVVSVIRDIVNNSSDDSWYLIWFALKDESVVFLLFNTSSKHISLNIYNDLLSLGVNLERSASILDEGSAAYKYILDYVEPILSSESVSIVDELKELEIASQLGTTSDPSSRQSGYDIEKANENFKRIGREGERIINNYLKKKRNNGEIFNYHWYNEKEESGLPYDFHIETTDSNTIYLDVKTTNYDFNQRMIFSSQEINYIATSNKKYNIYRVYKENEDSFSLRVCDKCVDLASTINSITIDYKNNLYKVHTGLQSAKLEISPEHKLLSFKPKISLH